MFVFKIVIGVGALFNTTDAKKVYAKEGLDSFNSYMRKKENTPLKPGPAFAFIKKMMELKSDDYKIKFVIVSRFSPTAGMRVMNSMIHYGLDLNQVIFCQQTERLKYVKAVDPHLFLSTHPEDIATALSMGVPAAVLTPRETKVTQEDDPYVRIAVDGDSCIFSDEADQKYRAQGLEAFRVHELENSKRVLGGGPLKPFVEGLAKIQSFYPKGECPIKLALVTARGCAAYERPIRTLRHWGITIDEAIFCDGDSKGKYLEAFGAEMFFDDSRPNCISSEEYGIPAGHVPNGEGGIVIKAA